MKYTMILILSILLYTIYSCQEEIDNSVNPYDYINNDPEVEVLWKIPINSDTLECSVLDPVLYNGNLLFGGPVAFDPFGRIALCNTETQELIWEDNCELLTTQLNTVNYQNIFVGFCSGTLTAYDLNDGNVIWTHDQNGGNKIANFDNKIFYNHRTGSNPFYSSSLVMADINIGIWDTVFTVEMEDEYSASLYPPGVFVNNHNDTILYFQNRQWNFHESDGKIDLYAYNLSADSIYWVNNDVEPDGNSSVQLPLIYDEKVYFRGNRTVYCFDAYTGNKTWEKNIGVNVTEDLLNSNSLIVDDMLIVKTGGYYIYAFDPETGDEIWSNENAGATPSDMKYYNGNLYYGSAGDGMIHVIDAANGETVIDFYSWADQFGNYNGAGFFDAVAIDPVKNVLYAGDGYYVYCIKIDW